MTENLRNRELLLRSLRVFPVFLLTIFSLCSAAPGGNTPLQTDPGQRARVVVVHDPQATEAFKPNQERIQVMVNRAITNLTERRTIRDAWRSLVSTQDVVGIKVFSTPGPKSGTRPAVVAAVVKGLLTAGLPPKHIIVWDKQISDLKAAGFLEMTKTYGIRVTASAQADYDDKVFYDAALLGNLVWGDHEFGKEGPGIGRNPSFQSW